MVRIFTTISGIRKMIDQPEWLEIIRNLGEVFIADENIDIPEDYEAAAKNPFYLLDEAVSVKKNKSDYINTVPNNPELVLEEPCGIFLLNIPKDIAYSIQRRFGVICQSTSNMSHDVLTHKGTSIELIQGIGDRNWSDVFQKFKSTPSNSVIIIDAHLFENDSYDERNSCYDESRSYGRNNLFAILDNILPDNFDKAYHVSILLTDIDEAKKEKKSRTNLTNLRIVKEINKLRNKIRPYEICIEVHFFSQHEGYHNIIHNRRILSNYYVLDAQYKLAAFDNDNRSREGQTISIHPLFELIYIDPESDTKARRLISDLEKIKEYVEPARNHSGPFYQNGRKFDSYDKVKHRLMSKK